MNFGAEDHPIKIVISEGLPAAVETCLARAEALTNWMRAAVGNLKSGPDFDS